MKEEIVKIVKTRLSSRNGQRHEKGKPELLVEKQSLLVLCGEDSSGDCLEVLEIQPPSKKVMPISSFLNGLNGRRLRLAESAASNLQ